MPATVELPSRYSTDHRPAARPPARHRGIRRSARRPRPLLPRLAGLPPARRPPARVRLRTRRPHHFPRPARRRLFPPAQPGRTLAEWPQLLGELADALGLDEFRVLGVSGGGPLRARRRLGIARTHSRRLRRVQRAAAGGSGRHAPPSIPPINGCCTPIAPAPSSCAGSSAPRAPWRDCAHRSGCAPGCCAPCPRPRPKRWAITTSSSPASPTTASPGASGADGLYGDGSVYAQPWGFPLSEVRIPVRLWHGKLDRNFAWQLAEEMVAQLPNCEPPLPRRRSPLLPSPSATAAPSSPTCWPTIPPSHETAHPPLSVRRHGHLLRPAVPLRLHQLGLRRRQRATATGHAQPRKLSRSISGELLRIDAPGGYSLNHLHTMAGFSLSFDIAVMQRRFGYPF